MAVLPFGLAAAFAACSDATTTEVASRSDGGSKSDASFPTDDAGAALPGLTARGILLVHAASVPPLRVCFGGRPDLPPLPVDPDAKMPESNVVGLDVGSVVRLPNVAGALGQVYAFPEAELRKQVKADGGDTYACRDLVSSSTFGASGMRFGEVSGDLSTGLHLVALTGCESAQRDPTASAARCGADWTAGAGNLTAVHAPLRAARRNAPMRMPVQVVQLSPSLEARAATRPLAFGVDPDEGTSEGALVGLFPFGVPAPAEPEEIALPIEDAGAFATTNLVVDVVTEADAGRERVLSQTLAETQRLTLPGTIPPAFFASISSFLVLTLGDVEAPPDAGDPRSRLHLLAVPLAIPSAADASADESL